MILIWSNKNAEEEEERKVSKLVKIYCVQLKYLKSLPRNRNILPSYSCFFISFCLANTLLFMPYIAATMHCTCMVCIDEIPLTCMNLT